MNHGRSFGNVPPRRPARFLVNDLIETMAADGDDDSRARTRGQNIAMFWTLTTRATGGMPPRRG